MEDYGDYDDEDYEDGYEDEEQQSEEVVENKEQEADNGALVYDGAGLRERLHEVVQQVSRMTSLPTEKSSLLLQHCNWKLDRVGDEWFSNEQTLRQAIGACEKPSSPPPETCAICFEAGTMLSEACGHYFCTSCWAQFLTIAIQDNSSCLTCPQARCSTMVSQATLQQLLGTTEHWGMYQRRLLHSFVESQPDLKWCPAPNCQNAVQQGDKFDACCKCSHSFCWNCSEEIHRPVDCETVGKWAAVREESTSQWIATHTKNCPRCKKKIEKNNGCMHMTCTCKHEFCWLCLGLWKEHGEKTGGFLACNIYKEKDLKGDYRASNARKKISETKLYRFQHYYDRFIAMKSSQAKALECSEEVALRITTYSRPHKELEFLQEAWQQIAECRRVLRWTYAYGYYLTDWSEEKKLLFEYLQSQAESQLEALHGYAEEKSSPYSESGDFPVEYRSQVVNLTRTTAIYFANLVKALENGLET